MSDHLAEQFALSLDAAFQEQLRVYASREEAESAVTSFVKNVGQYKAIGADAAAVLLGHYRTLKLSSDPIRGKGPAKDWFYPWSVADYLMLEVPVTAEMRENAKTSHEIIESAVEEIERDPLGACRKNCESLRERAAELARERNAWRERAIAAENRAGKRQGDG